MAGSSSKSRQKARALAPKPTPNSDIGSGRSPSTSEPNTSSQLVIFDDLAAGVPVTMPNQPYRDLAQRVDSPYRQLPIEQLVDTRLCVSSLTPQQCREVMMQLDDRQIKNAVYDRTLCFPHDQWTQNIRAIYGQQVEHDTRVVTSFENMTAHMDTLFAAWKEVVVFNPLDYDNIDAHVKSYVCPSIDNIGVYGTYSRHYATKINALSALLKVGQILVGMPILNSERGVAMFEYDALSRAVGNVLRSVPTDAIRRQIFSLEMESEFLELVKSATKSGLFLGLLQALTPAAQVCAYNVPRGDLLIPYRNQQAAMPRPTPVTKKRKLSAGGTVKGEASSTSPSTQNNPFSRPSSAGPVAMPPFAKAAYSAAAQKIKVEDKQIKQEQSQQGEVTQGTEGPPKGDNPGTEGQPAEEGAKQEPIKTTAYDDMLRHIEDAVFHAPSDEGPEEQVKRAPAVTSLIETTASKILKQFQAAAAHIDEQGRRDLFMTSLKDTAFALLWIVESCALNMGGSALSAEVSRTLSRVTLVGALWGIVRLGTAAECSELLGILDHMGTETFAGKLERVIRQLDESGVVGFGELRLVLANMRAGAVGEDPAVPIDPSLK